MMKWCVGAVLTVLSSFGILCHAQGNICNGTGQGVICPDSFTCCHVSENNFYCCSLENAVCCTGSYHCCPEGYTCHVKEGVCKRDGKSMPLQLQKIPATPTMKEIGSETKVVKCNQKVACPDRYTCCQVDSSYNCCPMPQAVCCSDHSHCCPRGFKCSPDSKTCSSGAHTLLALSATPSKTLKKGFSGLLDLITGKSVKRMKLPSDNAKRQFGTEKLLDTVVCPDGTSQCPDGNTCCKLSSGQWGCCPLPQAVCCSDGVHCCPNGYTCDVSAGTCSKGSKRIPMLKKIPALKSGAEVSNVICPDGQSECPDGNTCCKLSSGQWGCCPLPQAVCCSDGVHCCPNGYTCDVSAGTCSKGSKRIPMLKKIPALKSGAEVSNVICPDGQSECPDGNTCCKLSSGQWGCCPLPQAVCCSDGVHCCPNGYTCDVSSGTCSRGSESTVMLQKISALKKKDKVSSVICPDGQSECPDGNTCCKLSSGEWGCCPLPQAVCCSDGVHCCPNGYTCDVSSGTCSRGSESTAMLQKISALKKKGEVSSVICPDGQSECPDGNTCCKLSSGQWGCCPLPQAVCCSDGVHCCPNGYTCDVSSGTCSRGSEKTVMLQEISPLKKKGEVSNVICPDGQSECPDGNTCCKLSSGQYGCCPLPNAVCCSDGEHCCPCGYTCDVSAGTCNKGSKRLPMLPKKPASKKKADRRNVICPDGQSECPDGNTCCKLSSGEWGCCPLPQAVCCSDGVHCCPNGYTCDVLSGTCSRGSESTAMLQKISALKKKGEVSSVICPDGQSECPDGNTCCKLSSGQWGCCPLPQAVCCSDGVHCCPNGYTCDVSSGTCSRGSEKTVMLQEISPLKKKGEVSNVICPDGQSECPDGNTCCKLSSGQYGCCPLPNAVCCSDGEHCCPCGYTCDVSAGTCNKGSKRLPMLPKKPASKKKADRRNVICPDGQSECPDGNTCCKLSSGEWGCCPLPQAVCCSDGVHCCPNGYTCDVSSGTCSRGSESTAILQKISALKKKGEVSNVICPDGQSECPDGNTCCKLSSGQWGCCPLPQAVCCSDGVHCCPNGYTCDVSSGTCSRGSEKTVMLQEISPLKKKGEVSNVICPDGQSECPDGNTCCKLSSGQYGCCPLPNAVCCSDGEHCCPSGYTCDVSAGTCSKGSKRLQMLPKIPASKKKEEVRNVICPDGQSECPDGNTCCKLSSGQWGCCPLPQAVCCSDGVHCCPNGYTCDVSSGTCSRGSESTAMLQKISALKKKGEVSSVICPDGQSECPDGNTCCKLSSGQWGCCPLPQAVCCSDGVHCCPNGYTCDVSSGTCSRGSEKTVMLQTILALKKKDEVSSVICPDGQSECPDGNTCCKLSSGQYGCCPLPNAVCCSDGEHCCPSGYTCDVSAGTCNKGSKRLPMLPKKPASKKKADRRNVICPDGKSECPDGNTCCKLSSGEWGCCPLPQAVCCSDGVHCCPNGYTCNLANGTCSKGSSATAMFEKIATSKRTTFVGIICPDGESQCPDGSTCCKLSSGGYGCCPLPQAVCCSDGVHCCPNGYTCDVSSGTCSKDSQSIAMFQKVPASKKPADEGKSGGVVCPDKKYQCPKGSTCCKLPSGTYGCCPLEKAVCCSDNMHCCPHGYVCDVEAGKCNKTAEHINMIDNIPAVRTSTEAELKYIYCPDGSSCFDYETCCELPDGHYGCCPYFHAVCCSDHEHCCPDGYRCDLSAGMCVTGNVRLPMLKKMKSPSRPKTQQPNLDEKIHFVPGDDQGGNSVTDDGLIWPERP